MLFLMDRISFYIISLHIAQFISNLPVCCIALVIVFTESNPIREVGSWAELCLSGFFKYNCFQGSVIIKDTMTVIGHSFLYFIILSYQQFGTKISHETSEPKGQGIREWRSSN